MFNKLIEMVFPTKRRKQHLWWGLLWIWEKKTDYILWNWWMLKNRIKNIKAFNRQPKYEYNQWAQYETRNYCTIYSAITELSFLFNYKFTLCQIKEIWKQMIKDKKLNPNKWAYLSDAIDYTRKWWNLNFPDKQVESYRFSYLDETIWRTKPLKFLWLTQIGYMTSWELHNELQTKWFACKKSYPTDWWWHAVSTYWVNIIDNYKWHNDRNRYSFEYMKDLIKNWVIFENGYIFIAKTK